tara:strand:+ start:4881 stop:5174 length:294 start_codon:yes stop_codon:yes gene_type:complete
MYMMIHDIKTKKECFELDFFFLAVCLSFTPLYNVLMWDKGIFSWAKETGLFIHLKSFLPLEIWKKSYWYSQDSSKYFKWFRDDPIDEAIYNGIYKKS